MRLLTILILFFTLQSNAAVYYISNAGNTTNSGTATNATWSLAKLNASWSIIQPGDQILLNRGETFNGTINIGKSGAAGKPIYIGAYGTGAKPIITSLVNVTGWTSAGTNIWKATTGLGSVSNLAIVLINGQIQRMGRFPNYSTNWGGYVKTTSATSTTLTDAQIGTKTWGVGATLVVKTTTISIDNYNITAQSGNQITFTGFSGNYATPGSGDGWFIQNSLATLDAQNEWFFNKNTHELYIYSITSPVNVQAATANNLINAPARSYITVDGLQFNGSNDNNLQFTSSASNVIIQNCDIRNSGRIGISAENVTGVQISNNSIINSLGWAIKTKDAAGARILDNTINWVELFDGMGNQGPGTAAVSCNGNGSLIQYNTIKNIGFIGIKFNGDNILVKNNLIDSFCIRKTDGGAIYEHGAYTSTAKTAYVTQTGQKVIGNIILHGIGTLDGAPNTNKDVHPIYLDEATNGILIDSNVVAYSPRSTIYLHDANNNTITNNVLFDANMHSVYFNKDGLSNVPMRGNIFKRNIVFNIANKAVFQLNTNNNDLGSMCTLDNNYYCRPLSEPTNSTASPGVLVTTLSFSSTANYSLDLWKKKYTTWDISSSKTVKTISSASEIRFEYNATKNVVNIPLNNNTYIDPTGISYTKNVLTLQPYTAKILLITPNVPLSTGANVAPAVSLTSPVNNQQYTAPGTVTISATATDADGTINRVDFYNGSTLLFSDNTAPYSYTWSNVPSGTYNISAKATDNGGLTTASSTANIIVNSPLAAPGVSLTSPANNASYIAPANIPLAATATDVDGFIKKVEFYNGTTLLYSDTTAPFSYAWNGVGVGNYTLTAKATDNNNLSTTSGAINVTVSTTAPTNTPPTISLTSPLNGGSYTAPASINITANASDANGTVSKVDFYNGSTLLFSDNATPYVFVWNNIPVGKYNITATATDNAGASTSSGIAAISVNAASSAPTVTITSPVNNSKYNAPASISVTADAFDADGTITKIDFYDGTKLIWTENNPPYIWTWNNVQAGNHTLSAKAYDNSGKVTTSGIINVSVTTPTNVLPTVSLTAPANNSTYTGTINLSLTANASDADGTIAKVEFYSGSTLLGTDLAAPYVTVWNSIPTGTYTLTAKAYDNAGGVTTSAPVTITVNATNQPPTVSLISPLNNDKFISPATVNIAASALDNDGYITKVDFYNGTTLIGTATSEPYTFDWLNVQPGSYTITAKATDNKGAVTTSTASNISVRSIVAPDVTITSPTEGQQYTAPATLTITATAKDPDGFVTKVEFYRNNVLVSSDATAPYTYNLTNVAAGSYNIMAKAYDDDGQSSTSSVTTYVISPVKKAPQISITTDSTTYRDPAYMTINSNVTDADGYIVRVDFFANGVFIGSDGTPPFRVAYTSVMAGSYSITARAIDNDSLSTTSAPVNVTVTHVNIAPTLEIIDPSEGGSSPEIDGFDMTVAANDEDGKVAKVEFFNGTTLLGTVTAAPYTIKLYLPANEYDLTVKATDNSGATTTKTVHYTVYVIPNTPIQIKGFKAIFK